MVDRALGRVMTTTWPGTSRSLEWSQFISRRDDPKAMEPSSDRDGPTLGRDALAYADTLYNLARHLAGNAADAEDLVQDTYRRAVQAADPFTPRSNPQAWVPPNLLDTVISSQRRFRRTSARTWTPAPGASAKSRQRPC